jgi:hypothetical protein
MVVGWQGRIGNPFEESGMSISKEMEFKMTNKCFSSIARLDSGEKIEEEEIIRICQFIDARYDCSDFAMTTIIKTLYSYIDKIEEKTREKIKETVLNFKYWIDEPGDDSMCYWSENHQILFASCEYLAGQYYPDEIFPNADMTGIEHMEKARKRILHWLKNRWDFGFIEWHSNVYYEEDIAPLANLIDFAKDKEVVIKSKIIMDILLLDIAIHSYKGLFGVAGGRCYEEQKKHPLKQDTICITEHLFGFNNITCYDYTKLSAVFILSKRYDLPGVIKKIAYDVSPVEIKTSMGLDLKEIKNEFKDLSDIETTGMFLWSMEAFTNPEAINMAFDIFNSYGLQKNEFLKDFNKINISILRKLNLLPLISKVINPATNGIAIQRANTYTYRTNNYMLSTAQKYHPGEFGCQHHIWQATLSSEVTVFTTHPTRTFSGRGKEKTFIPPSHWIGNGCMPHSVQYKNVNMSIYNLNRRRMFLEAKLIEWTHGYFPAEKFDEVILKGNYVFGKLKDVYIALIGKNNLTISEEDKNEIIQEGKVTYWICIIGSKETYASFENFVNTIKSHNITYKDGILTYRADRVYELKYNDYFKVNGEIINTGYDRLDTPYAKAKRKPDEVNVQFKGSALYLNFDKLIRLL